MMPIDAAAVSARFDLTFAAFDVRMRGGFEEPVYLPAGHPDLLDATTAEVRFSHDYAASALHEAAHWCIAGVERRALVDYGYEYLAPPRDARVKARFFDLEARTQALECLFARAAGLPFRPSLDDLTATSADLGHFATRIEAACRKLRSTGLPRRAARFVDALHPAASVDRCSPGRTLGTTPMGGIAGG